jgi:PAS domain-containing protein
LQTISYAQFLRTLADNGRVMDVGEHSDEWVEDLQRLRRLGSMPIEIAMVDGTWLQLNDAPTDDGGIVTTLSDITDMKRHQVELFDSEQRFRDFTSAASDWVWELDAESRFTHVSGRFSEVSAFVGNQDDDSGGGARFLSLTGLEGLSLRSGCQSPRQIRASCTIRQCTSEALGRTDLRGKNYMYFQCIS